MRRHKDNQKWWLAVALLVAAFAMPAISLNCPKAHAYLGAYAPSDTTAAKRVVWPIAVTDTAGVVNIDPTAMTIYCSMNGTVYDSTGKAGTRIMWLKGAANAKFPGAVYASFDPSSSATTYGHGMCFAKVTVQGCVIAISNTWECDSLHSYESNVANIGYLTTTERTILADTVANGRPTRWAFVNDSVWTSKGAQDNRLYTADSIWTHVTRTLTDMGDWVDSIWANADTLYAIVTDTVNCNVVDTLYTYATLDSSTTSILERILGLSQENHYIDETTFTGSLMTSCRIRLYSSEGAVGSNEDVITTYRVTATYDGNNMETYKVVRE